MPCRFRSGRDTLVPPVSATLIAIYCLGIVGASLFGGALPSLLRLTHRRLQMALSFVAGAMLGVALFHMLPHAVLEAMHARPAGAEFGHGDFDRITIALVAGFLAMFLLERFARFHRHEPEGEATDEVDPCTGESAASHGHGHAHGHTHGHGRGRSQSKASHRAGSRDREAGPQVNAMQWGGALMGLSLHALLEGVALAASVLAGHAHDDTVVAGVGTFLVILLHKPFDSMTLLTLVRASNPSAARRTTMLLNLGFALVVPVGAFGSLFLMEGIASSGMLAMIVPLALAFSAGTFLCIASSDLLPELQFHQHDRAALSFSLVLGLAGAWSIGLLESEHHHHGHDHGAAHDHAHDHGHDHDHDHAHDHDHDHDHAPDRAPDHEHDAAPAPPAKESP